MSEDYKSWLYHPDYEPRIFTGVDAVKEAEADGWKDNPAKCKGFLDKIGVDPANALQVQYVGEVAEQTAEVTNLIENVETLDKKGVLRLVELHFSEDWSTKKQGVEKLREAAVKRLDADNVIEA